MSKNSKSYNKKNYMKYWGQPSQIKSRTMRVLARRKMIKKGLVKKGDNKEVDHIKGTKAGNGDGNLRVLSRKANRQDGQKKAVRARLRNRLKK